MSDFSDKRVIEFSVGQRDDGSCAGDFLRRCGVSRRLVIKLKRRENGITVGGKLLRTIDAVHAGDIVRLELSDEKLLDAAPELKVIVAYEDDDVVVFDKPADMPVHPSHNHQGDTLGNAFSAMFPTLTFRPINRLDRDTSGLCAVAKNAFAANALQKNMHKVYTAAVCGVISENGRIDAPIGRAGKSIIKREVRLDGQSAVTDYTIIKGNEKYTLLRIVLLTGRTHQIRVHFSHIGYPLAGDAFYGGDTYDISRQALHCTELEFVSPVSKKAVHIVSALHDDMSALI